MTTSTDIVNQALQYIGNDIPPVTGVAPTFDSSTAGQVASKFYAAIVRTVGRQFAWDMARSQVALTLSGNAAPLGWLYEYLYPSNGIEVWQLLPGAIADANNPLPVNWSVGNTLVSAVQTKVIWSNQQGAVAVYNNNPSESVWDPGFQEAVVRLAASVFAMALSGKPDVAQAMIESGGAFESIAEMRPD